MSNTQPEDALPPVRAGDRESRMGGVQYCLSPLPLPTDGEHARDVAQLDVHHDAVTMDIRQVESPDSMMTSGHILSGLALFMNGFGLLHRGCADFNGSFAGDCGYRAIRGLMAWVATGEAE